MANTDIKNILKNTYFNHNTSGIFLQVVWRDNTLREKNQVEY